MSAAYRDQAVGLRQRVMQRARAAVFVPPVICADFVLFQGAPVAFPKSTLVWHWRRRAEPAVGWDLHRRLHVVGLPEQFQVAELRRWCGLFPLWHVVGHQLELLVVADIARVWLRAGDSLLPRLKPLLAWLCKNRPEMPIIFAGVGSSVAQRLQFWAQSRYSLRCFAPAQEPMAVPRAGYYRLLRCAYQGRNEGRTS
ncbi:MAG: hypothetical protein NZ550_00915 [Fimbriimonadales bacterium]|nr:hypothetical protein [Fimbriimonadales bacterium]MDW8051375.1 hypothetical protein [Armatimonadota bacterium]